MSCNGSSSWSSSTAIRSDSKNQSSSNSNNKINDYNIVCNFSEDENKAKFGYSLEYWVLLDAETFRWEPHLDEDRSVAFGWNSVARHRWCNSAAAGFALRAIEGATVLQQVMREKGKLEEAMHCAQNYHRSCLVDAAREVGRNTQMTSNSMHRPFYNN